MADKDRLKPWIVVRQRPNLQWIIIARYHSRTDAEGHMLLLRKRTPNVEYRTHLTSLQPWTKVLTPL
jgi:hypothetical protein